MIKKLIYPFAFFVVLSACSKTNVTINGNIKNAGKQTVYLEQLNVNQSVLIDSTQSDPNGKFRFKLMVEQPTFFNIKFGNNENVTFIASADENIEISGQLDGLSQNYWVDGSENSLWIKLLQFQLNNTKTAMDSLKRAFNALPQDKEHESTRQQIFVSWDSIINKQINFSKEFILKHAVSPASYYALYQKFDNENFILTPEENLHSFKVVATSLKAMYPESQYTQAIMNHLEQISKGIRNENLRQLIASTESSLPEINLPDIQGDSIALNSLKGKYILLDFAVLNTKESESYIKDLKKIYNTFRRRNVEIYQVCLDGNRLAWEKLVKQSGIDWKCVFDPDGLKSRAARSWNVQSIPANYIISPQFEIVGKNLFGQRLEDRLNDLLK